MGRPKKEIVQIQKVVEVTPTDDDLIAIAEGGLTEIISGRIITLKSWIAYDSTLKADVKYTQKYIPPDASMIRYALNNRNQERWQDRVKVELVDRTALEELLQETKSIIGREVAIIELTDGFENEYEATE